MTTKSLGDSIREMADTMDEWQGRLAGVRLAVNATKATPVQEALEDTDRDDGWREVNPGVWVREVPE